jgi:hypothetical protein
VFARRHEPHWNSVRRDIDYAADAVKTQIEEKFGRKADLAALEITANDRTITVQDGARVAEGTRDDLMAAIRKAGDYEELWQFLPIKRS